MKKIRLDDSKFTPSLFSQLPTFLTLPIRQNSEIIKALDYDKDDIYIYVESPVENEYRTRSCFHEPETINWIEKFLKAGETIFDIGANIGAYSLIMAKVNKGKNKIYSFEPNYTSYNELCKNIILNECQKSIFPFQIALSNSYGIETLNYSSLEVGSAYHTLGKNKFMTNIPEYEQWVITFSIDKFIKDFNIPKPEHIKIDVDGIEYEILKGAINTLSSDGFRSLNVEIDESSESCNKITSLLSSIGFTFYEKYTDINAGDPDEDEHKIYNYIFTKN